MKQDVYRPLWYLSLVEKHSEVTQSQATAGDTNGETKRKCDDVSRCSEYNRTRQERISLMPIFI